MSRLNVPVSQHDHIQGSDDAPLTLVEYGDYECPFCRLASPVIKEVQDRYGNQLRFVYRNFPLAQIHPHAEPAAETAEFAGANRLFWEMHDAIYKNGERLGIPLLFTLAESLRLSTDDLGRALETHEFLPRIRNDFLGGVRSGVNGTPTFFINDMRHEGGSSYEELNAALDARLLHKGRVA